HDFAQLLLLYGLREFDHFFAFFERDIGLLPIRPATDIPALAPLLPVEVRGPHALDLHLENLLDGVLDLYFVGITQNLESNGTEILFDERALFRDDREF